MKLVGKDANLGAALLLCALMRAPKNVHAPDACLGKVERERICAGVVVLPRPLLQEDRVTSFQSTSGESAPILLKRHTARISL